MWSSCSLKPLVQVHLAATCKLLHSYLGPRELPLEECTVTDFGSKAWNEPASWPWKNAVPPEWVHSTRPAAKRLEVFITSQEPYSDIAPVLTVYDAVLSIQRPEMRAASAAFSPVLGRS